MKPTVNIRFALLTVLIAILFAGTIFTRSRLNLIANSTENNEIAHQQISEINEDKTPDKQEKELNDKIENLASKVDTVDNKITQFETNYNKWTGYMDDEWAKLCTGIMRQKVIVQFKLLQEVGVRWENPPDEITQGVTSSITHQRVKLAMNIISDFIAKESETIASKVALTQEQKEPFDKAIKEFLIEAEKQLMATEFTEVDLDKRDFYASMLNRYEEKLKPVLQLDQQTILEKHLAETWVRRLRK